MSPVRTLKTFPRRNTSTVLTIRITLKGIVKSGNTASVIAEEETYMISAAGAELEQ